MEIFTSTDPSEFKLSKHNRLIDVRKAEKLAVAMRKNNLLPYYPIVVNKKMEVLDGQHRLEAARISDSIIYYVVSDDGYDILNVAETNALHTKWKLQDYIKYYSSLGYEDYERVFEYINKWDLPFTTIIRILSGLNRRATRLIRDGFFKIVKEHQAVKTYETINELKEIIRFWKHREFIIALYSLMGLKKFDAARFISQVKQYPELMIKQVGEKEYLEVLLSVYNHNQQNKIRI